MLAWIAYVIVVSLLLALAALALERAARIRQKPARGLWGASMTASLLLPLVMSAVSSPITPFARGVGPAIPGSVAALRHMTGGLSPSDWLPATVAGLATTADLDRSLWVGWAVASAILLLTILIGHVQLDRLRRRWERGRVAGVQVYVSVDAGPAIVGLWDPQIVVPRWLMQCSPDVQQLVIAHERSHLDAHDARLVTIALGLLVCMPWNLPLWWQLRRLRCAVEIDCDARVLRRGHDVTHYGETLIAIGERQSARMVLSTAMAEPRSLLERRLRTMVRKPARYARATAVMLACIGITFAAGAAGLSPPRDAGGNATSQPDAADTAMLDGHVGFYRLSDIAMFTIRRDGQHLTAKLTGQQPVPIFARGDGGFSYKQDKSISFVTGADGRTTSLILHQYGLDMPMQRIDGTTAQWIASGAGRPHQPQPERMGALIFLK